MKDKDVRSIFARRLKQELLRQNFSTKRDDLAKQLALHGRVSVTRQTVSHWFGAKHLPKPETMHGLSLLLGMDAYQLLREDASKNVREPRDEWPDRITGPDRLLFDEYLALSREQRDAVREMITSLAKANRGPTRK
jgi:transcriptional regulator with XRE-family HTH domain